VNGLYESITDFIALGNTDRDNFYSYVFSLTLITGIMSTLTVFGALYGLIVSFAKITQAYVTIAWLIVARYIINNLIGIIILISLKDAFLSNCEVLKEISDEYSENMCNSAYDNTYFATVVTACRTQQLEKDKNRGSH
ncbi:14027_t:CDS:2, partial [Ambispora leptoticha]